MARRDYPSEATLNWTERQRQVLDLLARGKTNAEIAEILSVSLSGAKWHVSEVISKLAVQSREEAADYWRERNSVSARSNRALQAITGLLTLKTVGGGILAAVAGGVAVGAIIVAADRSGDDPAVAIDATPTHAPPVPTATSTPEGFVAEVPAPGWWRPPQDRPQPSDSTIETPCQTGWDEAVGYAYLEVPGNEYYWVVTPETFGNAGREFACVRHAGRVAYTWTQGKLLESEGGLVDGGGTFAVDPDASPSCGYSGPSGSMLGEDGPITLPIDCSVPLNIAYAIVDDGTPERYEALPLPTVLGFPRKAIVAGHQTSTGFWIEFFEADGTLVERREFTMPGQVPDPTATPLGAQVDVQPPEDPASLRPADALIGSSDAFVPEVDPPPWLTAQMGNDYPASFCAGNWDEAVGVASFTYGDDDFFFQVHPGTSGTFANPDRVCAQHFSRDGRQGGGSFDLVPDRGRRCGYGWGGPNPHWIECVAPARTSYAIIDDGTPDGVPARLLPTVIGVDLPVVLATHTTPDGSMRVYFYDENDVLIDAFERKHLP